MNRIMQLLGILSLKDILFISFTVIFFIFYFKYMIIVKKYENLKKEYITTKTSLNEERKKVYFLKKQLETVEYFKQKNKEIQNDRESLNNKVNKIIKPDNRERVSYEEQKKVIKIINNIFSSNNTAVQP